MMRLGYIRLLMQFQTCHVSLVKRILARILASERADSAEVLS